jgi:hypothetical protein
VLEHGDAVSALVRPVAHAYESVDAAYGRRIERVPTRVSRSVSRFTLLEIFGRNRNSQSKLAIESRNRL